MAIWLARSGVRVRIIDKNQEPAPYSRALAVQPRTLEFYRQLGFGDEVAASGLAVPGVSIWVDGKRTARVPFSRIGEGLTPYPYLLIFPQDEHERFLLERLQDAGIHVERNTELVSFEQSEGGVHATLRTADASPVTCIARYLAGCDGAHSTVRANLGIGFPGGSYSRLFYVADVEASGATVDRELHIELDESDDLLAVFPLKAQGRVRLVGVIRDDRIAAGRVPVYEDIGKKVIDRLDVRVTAVNWFSSYRVHPTGWPRYFATPTFSWPATRRTFIAPSVARA